MGLTISKVKYLIIVLLLTSCSILYRKEPIVGHFVDKEKNQFLVNYYGRDSFIFNGLDDIEIKLFFKTLTKDRVGKKQLKHLLNTNAKVQIEVSNKIGILYKDSTYRCIAAITGVNNDQSSLLIPEYYQPFFWWKDSNFVHKENSITFFKGFLNVSEISTTNLTPSNTTIINWHTNETIPDFSMDTIKVEPFMFPDLLYQNKTELYFFGGVHEIEHIRPENIKVQLLKGDIEKEPMKIENKAFKKRKKINN